MKRLNIRTWLGIVLLVVLAPAIVYFFLYVMYFGAKRSFEPNQYEKREFTRLLPAPLPATGVEDIFSDELRRKYQNGRGINLRWAVMDGNETIDRNEVTLLQAFKTWDQEPAPERDQEIEKAKTRLAQIIAQINSPQRRYTDIIVFADNTTANQLRADLVDKWYSKLDVEAELSKGRGVRLAFHRITDKPTTLEDPSPVEIPPGGDCAHFKAAILERLEMVFAPSHTSYSAIASGVFNALKTDAEANAIGPHTHILLFSDLHENDRGTISFESGAYSLLPRLTKAVDDPQERQNLEADMQRRLPCPPLNGAHVRVYFPPTDPGDRSERMPLLFKLWSELFIEHRAASVDSSY